MNTLTSAAHPSPVRPVVCVVGELPPPAGGMAVQAQRLGQCLRSQGHPVVHVPTNALGADAALRKVKGARGVVNLVLFLAKLIAALPRADVVHVLSNSHLSFWLFTLPPVQLGRLLGKRVVIHYHGGDAGPFLARSGRLAGAVLRRGHALLVPSSYLVEVFSRHGFEAVAVPNIMALEQLPFRLREALAPRVLMARHLRDIYNPACGLRAFALLMQHHPEATLTVAGDGPERPALDALCAQLGIASRVRFLGNIDNARMLQQLQQHDLLLNTSRLDNQPVSLLEAFACGLPVVSTAVGGIVQMISDGENGLLAPSDDAPALAAAMKRLLDDPPLARRIAQAAHAQVQGHDWSRIYPQLCFAYGERKVNA